MKQQVIGSAPMAILVRDRARVPVSGSVSGRDRTARLAFLRRSAMYTAMTGIAVVRS